MFWRSGQIRLKRQNKSSKMRDLLIRNETCGSCPVKKTTSDGLIIFFPPLLCVHNISFCPPRTTHSRTIRGGRALDSSQASFKGLVLLKHETLFSGGDSPSCACPG